MRKKLKIQLIEQSQKKLRLLNSKGSTKTDLYGLELNLKLKRNNTKISTKMFSKIQVILSPTLTSLLKVRLNLQVLFSSLKEHLMINSKSSMKRNLKSNSMLEKSWSMINSKTFYQNTSIS